MENRSVSAPDRESRSRLSVAAVIALLLSVGAIISNVGLTPFMVLALPFGIVGLLLGSLSLRKIKASQGMLRGERIAYAGSVLSVLSLVMFAFVTLPMCRQARENARGLACRNNLKMVGLAIQQYQDDWDGSYPQSSNWCDAVLPYLDKWCARVRSEGGRMSDPQTILRCPDSSDSRGGYAYNKLLDKEVYVEYYANTVMCFDANGGWNAAGGPELKALRHFTGIWTARNKTPALYVLYTDGHASLEYSLQSGARNGRVGSIVWDPHALGDW